jgi:membrane-bound lytic murein transglycosylase B
VVFSNSEPPSGACSIFELPTPGKTSRFFAGFTNFEVITRYNRSTFYASAVLELGNAVKKAVDGERREVVWLPVRAD